MPAPRRSSRPVTRSLKSAQVAQERRSTVPTRARRKVSFSSLPTTSFANCPVAVYSVSTASSSLFDISPPRTRLTSLTEINVKKEPLFLHGLFQSSTHSRTTRRSLSPPPVPLSVLGVSCFARSLLQRGPPTLTGDEEGGRRGGQTWRVTPPLTTSRDPGWRHCSTRRCLGDRYSAPLPW